MTQGLLLEEPSSFWALVYLPLLTPHQSFDSVYLLPFPTILSAQANSLFIRSSTLLAPWLVVSFVLSSSYLPLLIFSPSLFYFGVQA
jgi:hypothetical protein